MDTVKRKCIVFVYFVNVIQKAVNILDTLDIILELLSSQNKRQKDLTDYLGISRNAFTNWKSGSNTSYMKKLPQIAEYFNVTVDELLGNKPAQNSDITFDDFTYALHNETKDLTDEQKQSLLDMARIFKQALEKEDKGI